MTITTTTATTAAVELWLLAIVVRRERAAAEAVAQGLARVRQVDQRRWHTGGRGYRGRRAYEAAGPTVVDGPGGGSGGSSHGRCVVVQLGPVQRICFKSEIYGIINKCFLLFLL